MPRLTKTQQKRLVKEILSKTQKLYLYSINVGYKETVRQTLLVTTKDMEAIERLTQKWLKRIG